ncbi:hypothetical protein GCM10010104_06260 [Streptomyces indiaensis]|uniref:Uncharacterized protein n=1 Tax=Streptomyces indiaensis TaxID=284033 RepID=A0ABP5PYL7_9ACTN
MDHRVDLDVDNWTENTIRTDAQGHFSGTVTVNDAVPVQAVYRHDNAQPVRGVRRIRVDSDRHPAGRPH